ncbi:hypothetical protein PG996_003806 [Apiospora saccharicola]|uniref:Uncharacterized protein n=1 Tax=Apiospora saccharicola TaxID=335842 RepID=A0ABR1W2C5_9PEZI
MKSAAALFLTWLTTAAAAAAAAQASSLRLRADSPEICNGVNLTGQCEDYVFNPDYCYTLLAFYLGRPGLSSFRGKAGTPCTFWEWLVI